MKDSTVQFAAYLLIPTGLALVGTNGFDTCVKNGSKVCVIFGGMVCRMNS